MQQVGTSPKDRDLTEFTRLLNEYIGFKSVSTDPAFASGIAGQVKWLTELFENNGFKVDILKGPKTNPVVLATYHTSDNLKTKLIYGHYDVQPASIEDGWKTDPFVLHEEDGRFVARGIVDNKGQNFIHIYTAINLIKAGKLGCNLKFMIEGNEETSNPDMADLVSANADKLKCDQIIISDGEILGFTPTIEESLRGGGNLTLKFISGKNDLHSGLFGSGVPSATKELIAFLAKMLLPDGTVTIPGFYDAVDKIKPEQIERNLALLKIDDPIKTGGVKATIGKYDFHTMVGIWPAIEVSGIQAGYTGEGYKNIIPASAFAKINFRLVASQTPEAFAESFKKYVAEHVPSYIDYEISIDKMTYPVKVNVTDPEILKIMDNQEKIYGVKPVIKNVGGGIPVVADFKNVLGIDAFLISLGNNDCNMHGVAENFNIELIKHGLELSGTMLG